MEKQNKQMEWMAAVQIYNVIPPARQHEKISVTRMQMRVWRYLVISLTHVTTSRGRIKRVSLRNAATSDEERTVPRHTHGFKTIRFNKSGMKDATIKHILFLFISFLCKYPTFINVVAITIVMDHVA